MAFAPVFIAFDFIGGSMVLKRRDWRVNAMSRKRAVLRSVMMNRRVAKLARRPTAVDGSPVSRTRGADSFETIFNREACEGDEIVDIQEFLASRRKRRKSYLDSLPLLLQMDELDALSRTGLRSFDLGLEVPLLQGRKNEPLACGLRRDQAMDLMSRDLTPEDFEMLSKLDEAVPKRDTADKDLVASLPRVDMKTDNSKETECNVCLGALDQDSDVVELPCKHRYHAECISKWLTQCKNACPTCKAPIELAVATPVENDEDDEEGCTLY